MSKYSLEFKQKLVKYCLDGHSTEGTATKSNFRHNSLVQKVMPLA